MSFKVRHYRSRIYNPIKKKIFKAVLAVVAAGLLFMLGWFVYEPLMKTVTEKNKQILEDSPVSVPEIEKKEEEAPLGFTEKEEVVVTVPEETMYSAIEYYEFLKSLPDYVTGLVLDMKTKEGTVTYLSNQRSVLDAMSISDRAVDISLRIETARKLGFDVSARIYAFEDHTAPYSSPDLAIRYESEDGVLWLDDSYDEGGKPWMNPYSDTAQKYIMDIVYDAVDLDFDAVIIDGMRFPGETGQQYAYYGETENGLSKNEVLLKFSQRIYTTLSGSSTDIIICYDAYNAITKGDYYGGSPAVFTSDALAPIIDLDAFIGKKISDGFYYKTMPEDVTELTDSIYEALGYATDKKIMPCIIPKGLTSEQFKTLTEEIKSLSSGSVIIEYNEALFGKETETETDIIPSENTSGAESYQSNPIEASKSVTSASASSNAQSKQSSSSKSEAEIGKFTEGNMTFG